MKCSINFKELSLYLDGRHQDKGSLETHIAECPYCSQRMEQIRCLKTSLQGLPSAKESSGFDFEFNRRLEEAISKKSARRFKIRLDAILSNIRDSFIYPVPAAVKVAVSFVLMAGILFGVSTAIIYKTPYIEFTAGEVQVYSHAQKRWVMPPANMRLASGDKIKTREGAIVNIFSRSKYVARIKDESLIVITKLKPGLRRLDTDINISYGDLLVNTGAAFKGSKMRIYTPACGAEVVGTAFMVKVSDSQTWLGVLEGKVKLLSKVHPLKETEAKNIATYVSSGQKAVIQTYLRPTVPELFSDAEWRTMQELYQLAETPQIMLLIGTNTDRIDELFKPAPVYIPHIKRNLIPGPMHKELDIMMESVARNKTDTIKTAAKRLEDMLKGYTSHEYSVEILMSIGSHYHFIHDYDNALRIFQKVLKDYPDSAYASLAQCAIATIYQKDLKDTEKAEKTYKELLQAYPDSVDAIRAKENLTSLR